MNAHRSASISAGLRLGLHSLVAVLVVVVVARAVQAGTPRAWLGAVLSLAWALSYALGVLDGARRGRAPMAPSPTAGGAAPETGTANGHGGSTRDPSDGPVRRPASVVGVLVLTLLWAAAAFCLPEAAYLVFPLFFVQLHILGSGWGPLAVVASTAVAVVALGTQQDFGLAGVIGPFLGAAVALLIGAGYRAFATQARARDALLAELVATRDELARTQRLAGAEAERARLSREIHDTVSQSLSSIQMLLHAAERATDPDVALGHLRAAREAAAGAQEEARAIVRALGPAPLASQSLAAALRRLAATEWSGTRATVTIDAPEDLGDHLGMGGQTALLRLAQGAVGNALQHAAAGTITVTVRASAEGVRLEVADDGTGFDPASAPGMEHGPGHFGLASMQERVDQLGGDLRLASRPGQGTTVSVWLPSRLGDDHETPTGQGAGDVPTGDVPADGNRRTETS